MLTHKLLEEKFKTYFIFSKINDWFFQCVDGENYYGKIFINGKCINKTKSEWVYNGDTYPNFVKIIVSEDEDEDVEEGGKVRTMYFKDGVEIDENEFESLKKNILRVTSLKKEYFKK